MTTYKTPAAAIAAMQKLGITTAVRAGASGPNNKLRRGAWRIDGGLGADNGRPATAAEARALNAIEPGYGLRAYETTPGALDERA